MLLLLEVSIDLDFAPHFDTSYKSGPLPQSAIDSDVVEAKGKRVSHPTLNSL